MTDEQIPETAQAGHKKFSFSLYSYFIAMSCLICIALAWFIVRASSDANRLESLSQFALSRPSKSLGIICEMKTNDEGAQNLLRYIMNNPPKASDREHMAKNIQEFGIELYRKNLEYLSDNASGFLMKDRETLKNYFMVNVEIFSRLKSKVQGGQDVTTLEDDELYKQLDEMKIEVLEIYNHY